VSLFRCYEVTFEGRKVFVEARIEGDRVIVSSLRGESHASHGDDRKDETHAAEAGVDDEGKPMRVALGAWTPEKRRAFYEAVREAAKTGAVR
jgi:hypothetical protein